MQIINGTPSLTNPLSFSQANAVRGVIAAVICAVCLVAIGLVSCIIYIVPFFTCKKVQVREIECDVSACFFLLVGGQVPLPGRRGGGGGGAREERREEDGRRRYAENNLAQQVSLQEGDRVSLSLYLYLGGSRFADTRPGGGRDSHYGFASWVGLCVATSLFQESGGKPVNGARGF